MAFVYIFLCTQRHPVEFVITGGPVFNFVFHIMQVHNDMYAQYKQKHKQTTFDVNNA